MAGGMDLGTLTVKVGADVGGLSAGLQAATASTDAFGKKAAAALSQVELAAQGVVREIDLIAEADARAAHLEGLANGAKKAEESTKALHKTMKDQFAGEVLNAGLQRIAASLGGVEGKAVAAAGAISQGFFAAGPLGAAIAATSSAIAYLVEEYSAVEAAAVAAAQKMAEAHEQARAAIDAQRESVRGLEKDLIAAGNAGPNGNPSLERLKIDIQQVGEEYRRTAAEVAKFTKEREKLLKERDFNRAMEGKTGQFTYKKAADEKDARLFELDARLTPARDRLSSLGSKNDALFAQKGIVEQGAQAALAKTPRLSDAAFRMAQQQYEIAQSAKAGAVNQYAVPQNKADPAVARAAHEAEIAEGLQKFADGLARAKEAAFADAEAAADHATALMDAAEQVAEAAALQQAAVSAGRTVVGGGAAGQALSAGAQGMEAGGPVGAAIAVAAQLVASSKAGQYVQDRLNKMVGKVAEMLGKLITPLAPFITIITEVAGAVADSIGPFLSVTGVLRPLVEVARFLGAEWVVFAEIVKYVGDQFSWLMDGLAVAVLYVMDIFGDYGAEYEKALASFNNADTTSLGDRIGTSLDTYWKNTDAAKVTADVNAMGAAAERVAGALNAPSFYKVTAAVMHADTGRFVTAGGHSSSAGAGSLGTPGSSPTNITIANLTLSSENPRQFVEELRRQAMVSNAHTEGYTP